MGQKIPKTWKVNNPDNRNFQKLGKLITQMKDLRFWNLKGGVINFITPVVVTEQEYFGNLES